VSGEGNTQDIVVSVALGEGLAYCEDGPSITTNASELIPMTTSAGRMVIFNCACEDVKKYREFGVTLEEIGSLFVLAQAYNAFIERGEII
jgi:hypothetical protein